ncbi:hypothetical protein ACM66Z_00335 [Sulfurovum sp. ST-21]|uniref:Uncharacterized protein n=1 Tax=Sulfurovum indicum TaxID=2779528 RepID=A0A7M1S3T1_9BACT|nr:hypothetical protein [Sulfurovum indicum]QOR61976.1 hypothetical protein IMZ28_00335 [Sulfurovum indicum]
MKINSLKLAAITAALTLAGCGGGSSTTSTTQISKISGTVPGTLIEAFCSDGSYYSVKSTDNGTTEHPFELEIPSNLSCRLVMTTNEDDNATKVVTPIGIITTDGNGTLFQAAEDIDLGYIDLPMSRDDINDTEGDGVSDDILSISVDGEVILIELENDPMDVDGDGLLNVYDNDDNDTLCNRDDDDDDGDGIVDIDNDLDDDGIDNAADVDDDNDGLTDDVDDDDDNDGLTDDVDDDDDNDGLPDDVDDDNLEDDNNTTDDNLEDDNNTTV